MKDSDSNYKGPYRTLDGQSSLPCAPSAPTTGIICEIYRDTHCKGGTLREFKRVTLLVGGPFEPSADAPAVKVVQRHLFGKDYLHAEPVAEVPERMHGYMAGGTFIFSSDGRFPNVYPLSLHDYAESMA